MRKIFRDATTELLTRLTRVCVWQDKDFHFQTSFYHHHCQRQHHGQVDLTETLFNDVVPIGLQHLDSYLWAVHHVEQEVTDIMNKAKAIIIDQYILLSSWGSWSLFHLGLLQTRKGREEADQYLAGLHGERGLVNNSSTLKSQTFQPLPLTVATDHCHQLLPPTIATDHDCLDLNTFDTQVQPALASRTAETEYLENLSEKLLPLLLKGQHMRW